MTKKKYSRENEINEIEWCIHCRYNNIVLPMRRRRDKDINSFKQHFLMVKYFMDSMTSNECAYTHSQPSQKHDKQMNLLLLL